MKKKISVIIPVYNAMTSGGGYITRCVDSVLAQKDFPIKDLEIILLNDGSTDNSLEILNKLKNKNDNIIKIIDQKNMGVAKTRNKGIDIANGEYIMFIDQDDWIDDDYCKTLYRAAVESNVDVVISGYRRPNYKNEIEKKHQPKNTIYSQYTISAAWAKIHKTDFLRKNKIHFFDNSFGEDIIFTAKEIKCSKNSYKIVNYIGYNWFINRKSVSSTTQSELSSKKVEDIKNLFSKLGTININNDKIFEYYKIRTLVFYILFSGRNSSQEDFSYAEKKLFSDFQKKRKIQLSEVILFPKGEDVRVGVIVALFVLIKKIKLLSVFSYFWCTRQNVKKT